MRSTNIKLTVSQSSVSDIVHIHPTVQPPPLCRSKTFPSPQRRPRPIISHCPFPPPSSWQPPICCLSLRLYLLCIASHRWNRTVCALLCLLCNPQSEVGPRLTDPRQRPRAGDGEWGLPEPQGNSVEQGCCGVFSPSKDSSVQILNLAEASGEPHRANVAPQREELAEEGAGGTWGWTTLPEPHLSSLCPSIQLRDSVHFKY